MKAKNILENGGKSMKANEVITTNYSSYGGVFPENTEGMKRAEVVEAAVAHMFELEGMHKGFDLINELSKELEHAGFKETVREKRGQNKNIYYVKDGCKYAVVFIYSGWHNYIIPVLIDRSTVDLIGDRLLFLALGCHDTVLRPTLSDEDGRNIKLHRAVMDMSNQNELVDHITGSEMICTKDSLRVVTAQQNSDNRIFHCHFDTVNSFWGKFIVDSEEDKQFVESLRAEGLEVKEHSGDRVIISNSYVSPAKMFNDINRIERKLLGQYRYNPIKACKSLTSVCITILNKVGLLTDTEFVDAKMYEINHLEEGKLIKSYYGLM